MEREQEREKVTSILERTILAATENAWQGKEHAHQAHISARRVSSLLADYYVRYSGQEPEELSGNVTHYGVRAMLYRTSVGMRRTLDEATSYEQSRRIEAHLFILYNTIENIDSAFSHTYPTAYEL